MAGELRRARQLKVGYFAQHQIDELDPERTAYQHLAERLPQLTEPQVRARLGAVGLEQDKAKTKSAALSGGEKARLVFALIAADAPQLLILDEPTNHLDVDAREALVEALNDYDGAAVLISHDRHFIELAADRLWLVAEGRVRNFDGDIDDYRRQLLAEPEPARRAEPKLSREDRARARREGAEGRTRLKPLKDAARKAEAEIARLTAERDRVVAALADPGVYGDGEKVVELNRGRADLERALAAAEERWLAAAATLESATF
jgi:ATP-binding cassette subfamily F protein 3